MSFDKKAACHANYKDVQCQPLNNKGDMASKVNICTERSKCFVAGILVGKGGDAVSTHPVISTCPSAYEAHQLQVLNPWVLVLPFVLLEELSLHGS